MDVYALAMSGLVGFGWSTVEEVAHRAGLPLLTATHAITELVGEGKVFVKADYDREPGNAILVYTDTA